MIEIIGVTKIYGRKTALNNINLTLPNKGLVLISGENGSGKTTIMNLIGALDTPNKGKITIDGVELSRNEKELSKYRESHVGFIFQNNNLLDDLTIEENLNILGKKNFQRVAEFLKIQDLLPKKADLLSKGEQERVAIARAIIKNPKIILADEPTASLDYESKEEIIKLLKALSRDRLVIVVSHDLENASLYADMTIELKDGEVIKTQQLVACVEDNTIPLNKNRFDIKNFAFKNTFVNRKKFVRSSIFLILSFVFVMLAFTIGTIDFVGLQVKTMSLEKDDWVYFETPSFDERITSENSYEYLEKNKISKNPIETGYSIYQGDNMVSLAINYPTDIDIPYFRPKVHPTFFKASDLEKVDYGTIPNSVDEIAVTSYIAEAIIQYGVLSSDGGVYKPKDFNSLIEDKKEILIGSQKVHISGIVESNYQKYEKYKKKSNDNIKFQFFRNLAINSGSYVYAVEDFFELKKENSIELENIPLFKELTFYSSDYNSVDYPKESIKLFRAPVVLRDSSTLEQILPGEIIANELLLQSEEIDLEECVGKTVELRINQGYTYDTLNLTIKGVSEDGNIYLSDQDVYDVVKMTKEVSKFVVHESDENTLRDMLLNFKGKYYIQNMSTNYSNNYESVEEFFSILIYFFIGLSVILTIVTVVSISNQILDSIDSHKREISILKSLGVFDGNISLVFLFETFGILVLSYLYALIAFICIRLVINWTVSQIMSFKVNFVEFNALLILAIILVSVVLGGVISVICYSKIKRTSPEVLMKKASV